VTRLGPILALAAITACSGRPAEPRPEGPTALPGDPPPDAVPAPRGVVATAWDVAIDVPPSEAQVTSRDGFWQLSWVDVSHTDGRLLQFIAMHRVGDAMSFAAELRGELMIENPICTEPVEATFLGRSGARFSCQLGDAWGTWLISYDAPCMWSVMISKRGDTVADIEPFTSETLARITVLDGRSAPRCR
jgi:hypothetical protein